MSIGKCKCGTILFQKDFVETVKSKKAEYQTLRLYDDYTQNILIYPEIAELYRCPKCFKVKTIKTNDN